jgi:outer membrane protein OmpA-like peptidoglycan-associated protein
MRNNRLTFIALACAVAPVFAQSALPNCESANYDRAQSLFTVVNPAPNAVNQQCLLTVHARQTPATGTPFPAPYLLEGNYALDMSGGGGGGSSGDARNGGGGGGGAGATPYKTKVYLAPGVYKLTLGTGGHAVSKATASDGARPFGDGNPSSLTRAATGELVAGFPGADSWTGRTTTQGTGGSGGSALSGSRGGSGGDSGPAKEEVAQDGGRQPTELSSASAGRAGGEGNGTQANAGGGGGAGFGPGGDGQATGAKSASANAGVLGGGGGGGHGGNRESGAGSAGGNGYIRLAMLEPAPAPQVVTVIVPQVVEVPVVRAAPVITKYSLSADALFDFNKSTIKPAGAAKLDDLIGKLRAMDVTSISDVGHADRIGTQEANQTLSENRAQSVKSYLVHGGIPSGLIAASGRGETQPVTAAGDCLGGATAKVIACLQPDRRVDIEVTGANTQLSAN